MALYRFYSTDTNRVFARVELECVDDAQAMDYARSINHKHAIEVWEGKRLVGLVPKQDGTSDS